MDSYALPGVDPGVMSRYAARRRLRPSFGTQAGALWEKNFTAQKRNWREELPPLTPVPWARPLPFHSI